MKLFVEFLEFMERCPLGGDSWVGRFHECQTMAGTIPDCGECRNLESQRPDVAAGFRGRRGRGGSHGRTLADLAPGESGIVRRVRGGGPIHQRILDLGFVPGAPVRVECLAPFGDPIKVKLRGYALSLRKGEARTIEIDQDRKEKTS